MGIVLMLVLIIVVLALSVVDSRDRVRRDSTLNDAGLRSWYDARYGRRGRPLTRDNVEHALERMRLVRRWGPAVLVVGTAASAVALAVVAIAAVPAYEPVLREPQRLLAIIPVEVLVESACVFALLPILVLEGALAARYVADLDIGRLTRLRDSL